MPIPGLPQAPQSALHPASDPASLVHHLTIVLGAGAAAIFLLVMALVLYGVLSGPRRVNARAWIVGGGLVFPVVVLAGLFVYALHVGHALSVAGAREPDVEVTGRMWWWEVRYRDPATGTWVAGANELYVPVGRPVELSSGLGIQPIATIPYMRTAGEQRRKRALILAVLALIAIGIPFALLAIHTRYMPLEELLGGVIG